MPLTLYLNPLYLLYRFLVVLLYAGGRFISLFYRDPSYLERLGIYTQEARKKLSLGWNLWIHTASAGEVNAIIPLCRALRKARPDVKIILTTTSRNGKRVALEKEVADFVFIAPWDSSFALRRAFGFFRPFMVLVAETELWPNMLLRGAKNGIPLILVNGRISDRSFPTYQKLKGLFKTPLNCFHACYVQTERDKERFAALGVSLNRLEVMGQMKYDLSPPDGLAVERFKESLSLLKRDVLFAFGSLRGGEDDLILPLIPKILALAPEVKVLIAPRHLRNAFPWKSKLEKLGVKSVLRTGLEKGHNLERVVILDTLGELSLAYAFSRAAYIGGTLVPIGGHNVMEPALATVPVCFGPYTNNVAEAAEALVISGGGFRVSKASELPDLLQKFLDPEFASQAGKKAFQSVDSMRGATRRTAAKVLEHWPVTAPGESRE